MSKESVPIPELDESRNINAQTESDEASTESEESHFTNGMHGIFIVSGYSIHQSTEYQDAICNVCGYLHQQIWFDQCCCSNIGQSCTVGAC